jgi:hypothetical protein
MGRCWLVAILLLCPVGAQRAGLSQDDELRPEALPVFTQSENLESRRNQPPEKIDANESYVLVSEAALTNDACLIFCSHFSAGQWYLLELGIQAAWSSTTGSSAVKVAVLDSGIKLDQFDLSANVSRPGCGLPDVQLGSLNHGTFVAGLIGANANNSFGISGANWRVEIIDVPVLVNGVGLPKDIANGIRCAADLGVDIMNLSFVEEFGAQSSLISDAIKYAQGQGALVVASAGNSGGSIARNPAALPGVVGVIGVDQNFNWMTSSDWGTWADLAAPGAGLLSLSGTNKLALAMGSGTSYAAALVSGAAALIKSQFPQFTAQQISDRLKRTSSNYWGRGSLSEAGVLHFGKAVTDPFRALWQTTNQGQVIALGEARHHGEISAVGETQVVGIVAKSDGTGYWLVNAAGKVSSFGKAVHHGDLSTLVLNEPIVGMERSASGGGYWLVASDGGVFSFGDATFEGSTGALVLNEPIVGMERSASGGGYWLVASDGGVFSFGDATFKGSAISLGGKKVVAINLDGAGYEIISSDGGVMDFASPDLGSAVEIVMRGSVVAASGPD